MNKSFATYTPRSKPMEYDAIEGRKGCEPESGNDWYGLKAFNRLCVFDHDPTSEIFGMPLNVSYSVGPESKGDPTHPFLTPWAAWVGSIGVRVGQATHIDPPADDVGENSSLYLHTKPTELTHAWNGKGDLAIAIQKDKDHIELKQYVDDAGTNATYTWRGRSPALFYSGRVIFGDPSNLGQLVCYYLAAAADFPEILYARFESEGWAHEHIVMPSMRVALKRLIHVDTSETDYARPTPTPHFFGTMIVNDNQVILYAIDKDDRDVTLTTSEHVPLFEEAANLDVGLVDGGVFVSAIDHEIIPVDAATIDIKVYNGRILAPLVDTSKTPPPDKTSLNVAVLGGDLLS